MSADEFMETRGQLLTDALNEADVDLFRHLLEDCKSLYGRGIPEAECALLSAHALLVAFSDRRPLGAEVMAHTTLDDDDLEAAADREMKHRATLEMIDLAGAHILQQVDLVEPANPFRIKRALYVVNSVSSDVNIKFPGVLQDLEQASHDKIALVEGSSKQSGLGWKVLGGGTFSQFLKSVLSSGDSGLKPDRKLGTKPEI